MASISGLIIPGCWIILLVYWLISAMRVKAIAERQSLSSALAHRIPLGFSYFLMADWHSPEQYPVYQRQVKALVPFVL